MKPPRSKFIGDMFALGSGQVLSKVLGFLAFAYLARTLGPATYGSIEYAASLSIFFALIIDCGLDVIGVREVSKTPERIGDLAAQIPAIRLLIAIIVFPVMGLCSLFAGQDFDTILLTWIFAMSLIVVPWKQPWLLQSRDRMFAVAMGEVLQMAVLYCVVRFFVESREDLLWIGAAQLASTLVVAGYYLWYQQRYVTPVRFGAAINAIRELVQAGLSIGLANMIWAFHQYSPIFLMMLLVGGEETGWFGASHRIVVSLLTFSYVYHFNLYPELARRGSKSAAALEDLLKSSFRVVAWASCFATLVLILLSRPLITLLYGGSFANATFALAVLVWILPITALGGHARWALITVGHQRFVMFSQIAGALVMLLVGPLLISQYGAVGASTAMVLACLAVWLVAHFFAVRWVGHAPPFGIALPPALLALAILQISTVVPVAFPLNLMAAAVVFIIAGPLVDSRLFTSLQLLVTSKLPNLHRTTNSPIR